MTQEQQLDAVRGLGMPPSWWRFRARQTWIRRFRSIMAYDTSRFAQLLRDVYPKTAIDAMANRPRSSWKDLRR